MDDELIYGQHSVSNLLDSGTEQVLEVWLQSGRDNKLAQRLRKHFESSAVPLHVLPRARLDDLLGDARHQGVAVRARRGEDVTLKSILATVSDDTLLVLLDGVQDPRNLGAVLRSADAAGAHAVVYPRSRGVGLTPAARKTASGAAEHVPAVGVANLARAMAELSSAGVRLIGAAGEASDSLYQSDLTGALGIVLGAEDSGLRHLTREHCDALMHLPMRGRVNSLNVSVAAGICLYEAVRQRGAQTTLGRRGG
ncbi:MAG: 23S rRNA (guanosine2251-2'-O)-methyltransferase [Gammaproteobacteria bacterium]|jgi:23S rRNA (guanosine2251-2'-O)-methyltransferase